MSVSTLLKNAAKTIGEGPHWDIPSQTLLYVDILAGDVHRWSYASSEDQLIHLDDVVSLIIPRQKGGYVVSKGLTLNELDWESQRLTPIVEVNDNPENRFNDGKCDSTGRLVAGTMGPLKKIVGAEIEMGSLYSLEADHTMKTLLSKINISNGLSWTQDNRTMFYTHSIPRQVYAFDYDSSSGEISNKRVVWDVESQPIEEFGYPDGMTIDANDKIWLACYGAGKVIQIDPETGKELQFIKFPVKIMTSCTFGGPNLDELFATCANNKSSALATVDQPLAGSVFKVTGLGAKGLPAYNYGG